MSRAGTDAEIDTKTQIESAFCQADALHVVWGDGHESIYPEIWLRHAPGFPNAKPPVGKQGRFPRSGLRINSVKVRSTQVSIVFQPGAIEAHFPAQWLREHCPSDAERQSRRRVLILWDKSIVQTLPQTQHQDVVGADSGLLNLYRLVLDFGFAIIRDVPVVDGQVQSVAELFGIVPRSAYADNPATPTIERIKFDPARNTGSFRANALLPHTDSCWRQAVNGMTFVHCFEPHPEGGESTIVDGFLVATRLRRESAESFELLRTVPLPFTAPVAPDDEWRALGRVIHCDADGELVGIRYNPNSIHALDLPSRLLVPMCQALEDFEAILLDPDLTLQIRLRPGDLLVLDNQRVLHGRTEFDPSVGARHSQSCVCDRDSFQNRFLALARKLQDPDADKLPPLGLG